MKKLILVNGTMGVGKSTICEKLYKSMNHSCWLDGDWCWMMNPFEVTEENKEMVMDHITYVLNGFLRNSTFEYIIFSWVMHQESIVSDVLNRLDDQYDYQVYKITLMCSEEELEKRITKDINDGKRDKDLLSRSIERIPLYHDMDTIKIDVGSNDIPETVRMIKNIVGYRE